MEQTHFIRAKFAGLHLFFKRNPDESNTSDETQKIEENYHYPANTTMTTITAIKTTASATTTPVREMSSLTTTSATKTIVTTTTTATTTTPYSGVSIVASLCNGRLGNQVNKITIY